MPSLCGRGGLVGPSRFLPERRSESSYMLETRICECAVVSAGYGMDTNGLELVVEDAARNEERCVMG